MSETSENNEEFRTWLLPTGKKCVHAFFVVECVGTIDQSFGLLASGAGTTV